MRIKNIDRNTDRDSLLLRCVHEESPGGRGPEDRERTYRKRKSIIRSGRGDEERRAEIQWPMTKREERSPRSMHDGRPVLLSGLRRIAEVGCYLTILVKRSHYTIGLDPGVTERHGSWTLPSQSRRLPSPRRAQTPRFVLFPAVPSNPLASACICERAS